MKYTLLASAAVFGLVAASPLKSEPKGHEYRREKHGDRRSPCPGLNVLANHGWLPRSGKDLTLEDIRFASEHAYNFAPGFYDEAVASVFAFNLSTTDNPTKTFNLDDLASVAAHDNIEFDGSLSRNDLAVSGDALHFDPDVWRPVSENLGLGDVGKGDKGCKGPKGGVVTAEIAAKARAARVKAAMEANPSFNSSKLQTDGSPGTTALYLTTLWDDKAEGAPKTWVKAFFEEERLAYREGFKTPEKVKDQAYFGAIFAAILAVKVDL
ncbi:uncharacterized protein DNG_08974 [Cephalotrichum gorgonifer]|uniref:Heme haloperoxidase family profile domain-containing protein n=1 Tax=Cephalotrichum gorgonifer TaxID=2041049 RepID=A0AAE8SYV5_9PEZI|nr:uncharacterized protein DNG_08974 [Cephalotrichum gorgonifer]